MIKKVVHVSDIHIRNYQKHDQYREAFNKFIKDLRVLRKTYEFEEMRIVIAGDLFHQKITISNEQFVLSYNFLKECAKICPVVIIAGNHDLLENNNDRLDSITPVVKVLDNEHIKYYKESKCYEDDNVVWCVYSVFEHNAQPDILPIRKKLGNGKTYIGLFHAPVLGSKTDTGFNFDHGVNLPYFDGCDIVMLGDIHKIQDFELKQVRYEDGKKTNTVTPIAYSGSMIQQNYGESIGNHGYLLWDIASKTYEQVNIESTYGLYKFQIKSLEDLDKGEEKLVNK